MDAVHLDEILNSTAAMLLYSQECEPDNMDDVSQVVKLSMDQMILRLIMSL